MSSVILYGEKYWYSPYVFTVFVALKEKGIPFEVRVLDLESGEHRTGAYRDRSLTARVPAIEHEGFTLSESAAIVDYLEEVFPAPQWPRLLPESPRDRARARQVLGWIRSDVMPLREERSTETMFYEHGRAPLSPAARAAADKVIQFTEHLVPRGASHLFGDFTIPDADLAFMLHRLIQSGDPVPERVRAYAESIWQRPSVQAYVTHPRPPRPSR